LRATRLWRVRGGASRSAQLRSDRESQISARIQMRLQEGYVRDARSRYTWAAHWPLAWGTARVRPWWKSGESVARAAQGMVDVSSVCRYQVELVRRAQAVGQPGRVGSLFVEKASGRAGSFLHPNELRLILSSSLSIPEDGLTYFFFWGGSAMSVASGDGRGPELSAKSRGLRPA
jgi:hypothetical protein